MIHDVHGTLFVSTGKTESFKRELAGYRSRRINQEHRLVSEVHDDKIRILTCRYHF